jgi:hypothetical protein
MTSLPYMAYLKPVVEEVLNGRRQPIQVLEISDRACSDEKHVAVYQDGQTITDCLVPAGLIQDGMLEVKVTREKNGKVLISIPKTNGRYGFDPKSIWVPRTFLHNPNSVV